MTIRVITADVMDGLRQLPDESVNCVVTSPPYYALRDYGTANWDGGDPNCEHTAVRRGHNGEKQSTSAGTSRDPIIGGDCRLCGARRIDKQIGLEATPELYVARLVEVFRAVRRVMRRDATLWLNLGDSYSGGGGYFPDAPSNANGSSLASRRKKGALIIGKIKPQGDIKAKDLIGIPWMVAFALRADGWYLRSDLIWAKPNPMPESVTDRCTKSHEYIFMLAKSAKYYYDQNAIREPHSENAHHGLMMERASAFKKQASVGSHGNGAAMIALNPSGRNKRSVWTIATVPSEEAHFALMPPALAEICIKAGTKKGDAVLDPFCGAGTTLLVADRLQRDAIGIDLSPKYAAMARSRLDKDRGGLLDLMEAAP